MMMMVVLARCVCLLFISFCWFWFVNAVLSGGRENKDYYMIDEIDELWIFQ
jgi:phosphate starvation-inducible membrane PsiE